jgi:cytochrome c-type biogenesis protein CcmF
MIPEIGNLALILGLLLAIIQSTLPIAGAQLNRPAWISVARPLAWGQFVFVSLAFVILVIAFVSQDFSVAYVAANSNLVLPVPYRVTAVWGSHEGSVLLWAFILAAWTVAVAAFSRSMPEAFTARVLAVMGMTSVGFLSFILFTSNPFLRHLPALPDGNDLNPLLQDPGMIIHPPLLYIGYVGFSVAFAFAIAALLEGRVDSRWVRWSRPWTNVAWSFLTVGIALGSWWAYYELGWGGWWFWDPVENASFMPWLVGTALLHSQAVTEKRGAFKSWTILLAIAAFSLSLLGTFLVRSGVLTSVHAFASDPARGLFILGFLVIIGGGALVLFALRAPRIASGGQFSALSRETMLLTNNLFLAVATAMVLLGTLYPLIAEAMDWGKISVGPPYFGTMFGLLIAPIIILMPFGAYTLWRQDQLPRVVQPLLAIAVLALLAGLLVQFATGDFSVREAIGVAGGFWVIVATTKYLIDSLRRSNRRVFGLPAISRGQIGMILAHIGVGMFIIGVTFTEVRGVEKDLRMVAGDSFEINGYNFEFQGVVRIEGPNYIADQGRFDVYQDNEKLADLRPEKRGYSAGGNIMTEAAIDPGLTRDLYVSLGEPLDDQGAWAVRIYVKPFIRFIWLGALMMMMGGFVAATDRRYLREAAAVRHSQDGALEATA